MDEATRERERRRVLKALGVNRRKIERTKASLEDLYTEQNRLVVEGDGLDLQPAEMARGADPKSGKALRESFGQKVRASKKKAPTRGKRVVAK